VAAPPDAPNERARFGALLVAAFVFALYGDLLFGLRLVALDAHLTFEPLRTLLADALAQGQLRWTTSLGGGAPIVANPIHAALYPPNWLLATGVSAAAHLAWLTALHAAWCAWGAWRLARRLDASVGAAALAAIVVTGAGAAASASAFANLAWSVAWVPWVLDAQLALRGAERPWRAGAGFAACTAMLLLVGDPFVVLFAALGVAALEAGGRAPAGRRLRVVLAGVAGVALAAPALVPALAYLPGSFRGIGFNWDGVTFWSLDPRRLVELVAPGVFGRIAEHGYDAFWASSLAPEKGHPLLFGLYVGVPVVALAVVGGARRCRIGLALAAWTIVGVLLALGRHGPLYPVLDLVPAASTLRFPEKWMVPASVPLALLAARGLDAAAGARRGLALALGALGALGTLALAAGALGLTDPGVARATLVTGALRGALPAAGLVAVLAAPREGRARIAVALVAVLVAFDLAEQGRRLIPKVEASFYERVPAALTVAESVRRPHERLFVDGTRAGRPSGPPEGATVTEAARWQRAALIGYAPAAFGVPLVFNADTEASAPLQVTRLRFLVESAPWRERTMILGSAAAGLVASTDPRARGALETVPVVGRSLPGGMLVARNPLARPRARVVGALVVHEGDRGYIATLTEGPDDLFARAALIEGARLKRAKGALDGLVVPLGRLPEPSRGSAEIVADDGARVVVRATASAPSVVVLADAHLEGATVSVDGAEERPALRVDYAWTGALVPSGTHEVVFETGAPGVFGVR
jgi:hypothetical protein